MRTTKIIRDTEYGCWSVQVLDETSGKYYWLDVSYDDKYKEVDIEWNQYIFYLFDEDDLERKAFQEDCDNYDEASSEVYCTLIAKGELLETNDGCEIAVTKWKSKTWKIRQ
jgi:hypothetical protein